MATGWFMVFDVESVGLHGEGFQVGWTVIDNYGIEIIAGLEDCPPEAAAGSDEGRAWVARNVPQPKFPTCATPRGIRTAFWRAWTFWKVQGATLAADVVWPVEARFLNACVDDDPLVREWGGPYPLIDIASVRRAAGVDPLATVERLPRELPAHNPLSDARQSARLLAEALTLLDDTVVYRKIEV